MGNTLGEDLARIRERGAEQLNYQSFLYQLNSVQFNVVLFPLAVYLYCRFYADRPKFNEMIIIRYVILLSWCQNLPVCQFLSG